MTIFLDNPGKGKVQVTMHTLDIAPLHSEPSPQKLSGMTRVLKGFHSFTCTPTRSSAIGMSRTCLYLPSYYYSLLQQEAQLMLTTGTTRLAVSQGQQTWYCFGSIATFR